MLAVILAEDDGFFRSVSHRCRLRRFRVVRYRDPVKLADNLPELRPDLLVARQEDFPLHWEALAAQVALSPNLARTAFCLFARTQAACPRLPWKDFAAIGEAEFWADTPEGQGRIFSEYLKALPSRGSDSSNSS
ncbi:MAG TPA: hypothetical protein VIO60_11310 [Rectinemataceae bacterium]